jgi:hypothetical protein
VADWWDGIVPQTKPRANETLWKVWSTRNAKTNEQSSVGSHGRQRGVGWGGLATGRRGASMAVVYFADLVADLRGRGSRGTARCGKTSGVRRDVRRSSADMVGLHRWGPSRMGVVAHAGLRLARAPVSKSRSTRTDTYSERPASRLTVTNRTGQATIDVRATSPTLFTKTQQRVLGVLFGDPDRSFYASELIRTAGTGSGAAQRELASSQAW